MRTSIALRWAFVVGTLAALAPPGAALAANVRVAIAQMRAIDGDVAGNLREVDRLAQSAAAGGAQIVVFPELVDVGIDAGAPVPTGAQAVPGSTTQSLGTIAANRGVWIATAVLEATPGGVFDTSVLIDARGALVAKVRKNLVYPRFRGARAFGGNFQDMVAVPSPWGPIALMNCADLVSPARRRVLADLDPSVILLSFANPQANLIQFTNVIAAEADAPAVGVNMIFANGDGGMSRFVAAGGQELWRAGTAPVLQTWDLTVTATQSQPPSVDAGDVQTIRLPANQVTLRGVVRDDGASPPTTSWSGVRGPGSVSFANASDPGTTATFSAAGAYVLELSASDGAATTRRRVSINVLPASGDLLLAGRWAFDGNFDDSSGNGNHGTPMGGAFSTDVPSGIGSSQSLRLSGSDRVRVADAASLDAGGAVTIAAWVKPRISFPGYTPNGGNDWAALISKGSVWQQESYALAFGAYYPVFARGMGEMLVPSLDESPLVPGVWHHVAAVIDPDADTAKIFIDGVRDHLTVSGGTATVNGDPLYIGAFSATGTGVDGLVDDMRVYTRALSDEEIAALVPGASVNAAPAVSIGAPPTVSTGGSASVTATIQDDRVPATSSSASWVRWRKLSGPGSVAFSNPFIANTTVTFSSPGMHVLQLEASDGSHLVGETLSVDVQSGGGGGGGGSTQSGVLTGSQKLKVSGCKKSTASFQGEWQLVPVSAQSWQWWLDALGTSGALQGQAASNTGGLQWTLTDPGAALTDELNAILSGLASSACGTAVTATGSQITSHRLKIGKRRDRASASLTLRATFARPMGSGVAELRVKASGPWSGS